MHLRPETLTDLSVILVHYHTPRLAAAAVSVLREDFGRAGLRGECVIVDNGGDRDGADALRGLDAAAVLAPGRNLGYAGGVNLGVAHTTSPLIVVMNPDVVVQPGCLAALCRELREGAAAAGPRFSWDREGRLLLPPAERRDVTSEALARLSIRGPRWARLARARWRRHARRHWLARETFSSYALSGALLAIRRDAWNRVGPFDEGFQLYFEETDWLARLARLGGAARYVPPARAVHRYDSSARHEPDAAGWFAASARRFEEKHLGRTAGWLRRLEGRPRTARRHDTAGQDAADQAAATQETGASHHARVADARPELPSIDLVADGCWIEISPAAVGYPAAGERIEPHPHQRHGLRGWRMPSDVWDHLSPGRYMLRVIDDDGREGRMMAFSR